MEIRQKCAPGYKSAAKIYPAAKYGLSSPTEGWMAGLKFIEKKLETVTDNTENEFLAIGASLMDFHGRAGRISRMSSTVANRMTGSEIVGAIDDLNRLLEKMEAYLKGFEDDTKKRLKNLRQVLSLISGILEPLENFRAITKRLNLLSITSRAQYASLVTGNEEIMALLDDVKKLTGMIATKAETVEKEVKSLEQMIEATVTKYLFFEETMQVEAKTVLESTVSVLCSITEQYGISTVASRDIAERSAEIERNIGEIITSLQFHDITRQQFEGVKSALNKVCESGAVITSGQFPLVPVNRGMAGILREVVYFCECQAARIGKIGETFVNAVTRISVHLGNISRNVGDISSAARRITANEDASGKTLLAEMERVRSSASASVAVLTENAEMSGKLSAAVLTLTMATGQMSALTGDIEDIADDMELIAFNAEIKSSQAGQGGIAFEVVVSNIKRLSSETSVSAKSIFEILSRVSSSAHELSSGVSTDQDAPRKKLEGICNDLKGLTGALSGLNESIFPLFTLIEKEGSSLSGDIGRVTGNIDIHNVVDDAVNTAVSGLNDIASCARLMLPEDLISEAEFSKDAISGEGLHTFSPREAFPLSMLGRFHEKSGNTPTAGNDAIGGLHGKDEGVEFF